MCLDDFIFFGLMPIDSFLGFLKLLRLFFSIDLIPLCDLNELALLSDDI